jgi:hypothetical protein
MQGHFHIDKLHAWRPLNLAREIRAERWHEGPFGIRLKKANSKHQYADLELMVDDRNLSQKVRDDGKMKPQTAPRWPNTTRLIPVEDSGTPRQPNRARLIPVKIPGTLGIKQQRSVVVE